MTNRKRAEAIAAEHRNGWCIENADLCTIDMDIRDALDAAERRGEERALRYYGMTRREYEGSLARARKARRARGGKR